MESLDPCSPPDLRHLVQLTDEFGVIQHTTRETPQLEFGYSIDDVARALVVVLWTFRQWPKGGPNVPSRDALVTLADRYLRFIEYCQRPDGRFHNFVGYDRSFRDDLGSPDAFGRTLWALGETVVAGDGASPLVARATALFRRALPHIGAWSDLRAKAFSLLGLAAATRTDLRGEALPSLRHIARDLVHAYEDAATDDWPWFEDTLRYSNGAVAYALLVAANAEPGNPELADRLRAVGLRALTFLIKELISGGLPAPVGNNGWYPRGGPSVLYDQQCVDAAAMVVACAEAWTITRDAEFRAAALRWWKWFFGQNTNGLSLYRPEDGAVYDGLTAQGVNENRGAESVVSFLIAHLKLVNTMCG